MTTEPAAMTTSRSGGRRSNASDGYVHKLRRDSGGYTGAALDAQQASRTPAGWLLLKFAAAVVALSGLLLAAARALN